MEKQGSHGIKERRHRRSWSVEEKRSLVLRAFADGAIVSQVARKAALSPSQLYKWRSDMAIDQADDVSGAGAAAFVRVEVYDEMPPAGQCLSGAIRVCIGAAHVTIASHAPVLLVRETLKALMS